jgi:DNA-binding CsgD family transcriptional regulator
MRAVTVEQRLGGLALDHAGASEALDRISTAVLLLDERGRVVVFNRAAGELLRRGDGLTLERDGQLRTAIAADGAALRRAIVGACATGSAARDDGAAPWDAGSALLVARPLGRPLQITVSPLRLTVPILAGAPPRAIVLVADPDERPAGRDDVWRRLFGFTAAETRVAALLATGLRVQDCADALSVGEATIRTHLKRLLHKTGSRTQSDLMRALVVGPLLGEARDRSGDVEIR